MMIKIQDFMYKASDDPNLLLSRRGWREVFSYDPADPWSELFEWWGVYNEHIQSQGGGATAGGVKTKRNFHLATAESLIEQAQEYKGNELFAVLAELFCSAFACGLSENNNDYGWYDKLRDDKYDSAAAYYSFLAKSGVQSKKPNSSNSSSSKVEHPEVAALRDDSRLMKPYSLNEPYFGSLKQKHSMNHQMRIDGLGAQATEEQNGSFLPGERLSKFDKTAKLVIRKFVRGMRSDIRTNLADQAKAQVARKLAMRKAHVEDRIEKCREVYARAMVE